jgi:hypothetical protein
MANYMDITTTRTTPLDPAGLLTQLRTIAPEVGFVQVDAQTFRLKKTAPWTPAEQATAQGLIDSAAVLTPQLAAQRAVDGFPIEYRALVLALIDQLNVIRAALPTPLAAITPQQALAAIRAKAGGL